MNMNKIVLGIAVVAAATVAQAKVYRAGLAGGYLNSYDGKNYQTVTVPDIGFFNGPEAGKASGNGGDGKDYPPVWQNNRTWCYHGQMYFDGGTYYFGKNIDDATFIKVNGEQKLKNEDWNSFKVTDAIKLEAGWYDVEFRLGNGSGGAGCSNGTKGRDGNPLGLGYIHYAADAESTPAPTATTDLDFPADPGDGSFLRSIDENANYIKVNSLEKSTDGYRFNVTSLSGAPAKFTVFVGATAGEAESGTDWEATSGEIEFDANETKTIELAGEFGDTPYYMIKVTGLGASIAEGPGVYFWQWSEVARWIMEPVIEAEISEVTTSSASFSVTLGYKTEIIGMTPPVMELKAFYGETDGGTDAAAWTNTKDFGDNNAAGVKSCDLTELAAKKSFYVRFAAKTAESDWMWTPCMSFSTSGPYLFALSEMGENDPTDQRFLLFRPSASAANPLTVCLDYAGATNFIDGVLPSTVDFAAGESVKTVKFKLIDNDLEDGNKTFTVSIVENAAYVIGDPASVTVTIVDDETAAGEVVWTGVAGDGKWETPGNWDAGRAPRVVDTAVFKDSGLAAGGSVKITTDQACCRVLKIERIEAMTFAGEGTGKLKLGGVTRVDLEGNEADHTISVPLYIFPTDGDNCVWDVNGAGQLILAAESQKAVSTVYLYKTGAGTLRFSAANAAPGGILKVFEGDAVTSVANAVKSQIIVGGGDNPASFVADGNSVVDGLTPIAYTNGTIRINGDHVSGGPDNFQAHEGGVVYYKSTYGGKYDLWGGTINIGYRGWSGAYGQHITAHQSDLTAYLTGNTVCSDYYDYSVKVEDGAQPIDFIFNGAIDGGGTGHNFTVSGNGTMQTLAGWGTPCNVTVSDITWMMDNVGKTKGSGSGNLTVGNSATVGGLGVWGGGAESQILKFQGSSGKVATLAPGSLTTDGDHVFGTYTVGSEAITNTVVIGSYSCLRAGVGVKETGNVFSPADKVMVYGSVTISGDNTTLDLVTNTCEDLLLVHGGTYTILEATDGITGEFATVDLPKRSWKVNYVTEDDKVVRIDLTVPVAGLSVFLR